jgi:hypothetical protein
VNLNVLPDFFQVDVPISEQPPSPVSWPNVMLDPVVMYLPAEKGLAVQHDRVGAALGEVQDPDPLQRRRGIGSVCHAWAILYRHRCKLPRGVSERDELASRSFLRPALEPDHEAHLERRRQPSKCLRLGRMLTALHARDRRMTCTHPFGELLLRESQLGAVLDDQTRQRLVGGEALLLCCPGRRSRGRVHPEIWNPSSGRWGAAPPERLS